ncbi:LysR family transcriptional regulator [Amedibacillus sp. YH-ame6]
MEIRVLRYFLAVAREENISNAAQVLHITQPTLSRQLMDLEEELDTQLFVRGNRKISLTNDGMFFRKRAQEIIDLVDKTESDFLSSEDIVSGDVCIGGGETNAMSFLMETAKSIQDTHPNIHFHIQSGDASAITELIDKGLIDFGVLIGPSDLSKYDYLRLPFNDTWGVLMLKDSPLANNEYIQPSDLWDLPLIASRQPLRYNELSSWIGKHYENLNIVATYNLIYNGSKMVESGMGYAITLDHLISTDEQSKFVFRPLYPPLEAGLVIVWKKYQIFSKPAELFLKQLQNRCYAFNEKH